MATVGDGRQYKLKKADNKGFKKAVKKSNTRKRKGIKKGLGRISKKRNIGNASLYWDKSM